jgi:hypothetical protein
MVRKAFFPQIEPLTGGQAGKQNFPARWRHAGCYLPAQTALVLDAQLERIFHLFWGVGNTVTWTSGGITASHTQMASSSCVPSSCNCRDAGIKLVVGLDTHTNNRPGSSWHDIWKAPFMWPSEGGWFSILSSCCGNDWLERPKFVHDVRCNKWIHVEQYWHRPRWSWCYHLGCCLHPTAIIMPRLSTLFSGHEVVSKMLQSKLRVNDLQRRGATYGFSGIHWEPSSLCTAQALWLIVLRHVWVKPNGGTGDRTVLLANSLADSDHFDKLEAPSECHGAV